MPTKQTTDPSLPSPAWTFQLMTGRDPKCRLPGWPEQYQQHLGEPTAAQVWDTHAEVLTALAEAHGFIPHYLSKRRPTGAAVDAWAKAFIAEHRY